MRQPAVPHVIARSEATWQSPGITFDGQKPKEYTICFLYHRFQLSKIGRQCQEIATAPLGPRNDIPLGWRQSAR